MPEIVENNPNASMHEEVRKMKSGSLEVDNEDLPRSTLEASAEGEGESGEAGDSTTEATSEDVSEGAQTEVEEKDEIRIGDQVFASTKEAIAYAERIEREKIISEAHTAGVREALEAQVRASAPQQAPEPEEDLEQEFYANPKETLQKVHTRARDEAIAAIRAEQQREKMWSEFLTENPDIRRKDAERILVENWNVIGQLTDLDKGKKLLAQKVRAEYAEIVDYHKPRTALSTGKVATAPSGGSKSGVTPKKEVEKILSLSEQLRTMRK